MNPLLILFTLLSLSNIPATCALTAPQNVSVEIEKDVVEISWDHIELDQLFHGYYIIVKDVGIGRHESPAYVHVSASVRCANVVGLRPGTSYEIIVSAHSDDTYKMSAPIIVSTETLDFLLAESLTVSNITNTSATFEWTHEAEYNIHHIKFKLLCVGVQIFTLNGELVEQKFTLRHESWSTSSGRESYMATTLRPHSRYMCHLVSVAGRLQSSPEKAPQVVFQTLPGRPSRPPRPRVSMNVIGRHTSNFSLELYPADDQFGPIDHYKVIAVPVIRDENQPRTTPYSPVVPLSELLSHTLSKKLVTKVADSVPFCVGEYGAGELPPTLKISGSWVHRAFKRDTYYSFVVVAFTKGSDDLLYTLSEPADPPVLIGHDEVAEAFFKKRKVTLRFTNIILTTMFSILGIFAVAFIVVFGTKYHQGSKRDAHYFAVDGDSSSDEETVYIKKPSVKEEKPLVKVLVPNSPQHGKGNSKNDWAVKNLYYNPAYEDMIYSSPTKEIDENLSDYKTAGEDSQQSINNDGEGLALGRETHWQVSDDGSLGVVELSPVEPQLVPNVPPPPPPPPPPSLPLRSKFGASRQSHSPPLAQLGKDSFVTPDPSQPSTALPTIPPHLRVESFTTLPLGPSPPSLPPQLDSVPLWCGTALPTIQSLPLPHSREVSVTPEPSQSLPLVPLPPPLPPQLSRESFMTPYHSWSDSSLPLFPPPVLPPPVLPHQPQEHGSSEYTWTLTQSQPLRIPAIPPPPPPPPPSLPHILGEGIPSLSPLQGNMDESPFPLTPPQELALDLTLCGPPPLPPPPPPPPPLTGPLTLVESPMPSVFQEHKRCEETLIHMPSQQEEEPFVPPPPPPPPLHMRSHTLPRSPQSAALSVWGEEEPPPPPPPRTPTTGEFTYTSHSCRLGSKNIFSHVDPRDMHRDHRLKHGTSLPPYFFVTLTPAPGASLDEYNIASYAFPLPTLHRLTTPLSRFTTPTHAKARTSNKKKRRKSVFRRR